MNSFWFPLLDPHCGRLTALIINTVYEYISDMATASTFDHVSYCRLVFLSFCVSASIFFYFNAKQPNSKSAKYNIMMLNINIAKNKN